MRCGCRLWARQILFTVDLLTPWLCCHGPATPVRHPRRFGLQGRIHDGGDLIDVIERLSSPAGSNVPQTVQSFVPKTLTPQNHRIAVHRKLLGNGDIGFTGSGGQDDTAAQSHLLWRTVRCDPLLNLLLFYGRKLTCICPCPKDKGDPHYV